MKKPRRVVKLTVETERTYVFRSRGGRAAAWCDGCGAETKVASVADAAWEAGLSELTVYQFIEARAVHFTEDADGRLLVCLNSLTR
jgi:hypothetical protein